MAGESLDLRRRLAEGRPLVLDGATGTELERRGAHCALPLWSAHALDADPDLVQQIHADYAAAGADLITANTFRTQARTLARGDRAERAAELTSRAVELARRGAAQGAPERRLAVLGSAPPLEDCYQPNRVPEVAALDREHAIHAAHLAAAGVDGILVETMNSVREAVAATRAAGATGLPVWVSFACAAGATLLSGEPLAVAIREVTVAGAAAVFANCLPPSQVDPCIAVLRSGALPFGIYPNLGAPSHTESDARSEECTPADFARRGRAWLDAGCRVVGGCCGTTPEHVAALARFLRN